MQRPVHKAIDDARDAPPESIYVDEKTGTTIACGGQGRAHVFSAEGRHVTSFVIRADAIEFRMRTNRWRAAEPGEVQRFKASLQVPR